jgi:protein-S-isoprenylcysteine O-methyltransferase Ste14
MIGWAFIGVWICWHVWSVITIRSWWNEDRLCTKGPYRFVRHPIYAGGVFIGIALALILNSWILLLWPIFAYFIWSALVRKEEKMMEAVFGDEYKSYAASTGRLLPNLFRK